MAWSPRQRIKRLPIFFMNMLTGSLGIAPIRECTHFLKIGFVVAEDGFYSYYIHQVNKLDKERKIVRKRLSFMHTKRFNTLFKKWVQFRVGAIPRLPCLT